MADQLSSSIDKFKSEIYKTNFDIADLQRVSVFQRLHAHITQPGFEQTCAVPMGQVLVVTSTCMVGMGVRDDGFGHRTPGVDVEVTPRAIQPLRPEHDQVVHGSVTPGDASNAQVRVGVKVAGEFVALIAQITLDLEFDVLGCVAVGVLRDLPHGFTQTASELLVHHVVHMGRRQR